MLLVLDAIALRDVGLWCPCCCRSEELMTEARIELAHLLDHCELHLEAPLLKEGTRRPCGGHLKVRHAAASQLVACPLSAVLTTHSMVTGVAAREGAAEGARVRGGADADPAARPMATGLLHAHPTAHIGGEPPATRASSCRAQTCHPGKPRELEHVKRLGPD